MKPRPLEHPVTFRLRPEELGWVLDRLPSAVVVLDPELTLWYRNLAAQRLFHPEWLRVGSRLPELGCEPPIGAAAARLFAHGVVVDQELVFEDGRTLVVDGSVHGETHRGVLRIEDVTARARRTRAGEDFVVNAAHEFLSPLTALSSAADVLARDPDPEVRERFVRHVVETTNRLIAISHALLVLARAEAGIEPPRLEAVRLRPLLCEIVDGNARRVMLECPADTAVLADADLLRQALVNVVGNAARHSSADVGVFVRDAGETAEIEVEDAGAGILPEHLDRVTTRFFTGAGRDGGGFGIGLSLAARAIDVCGGSFRVGSDESGTVVRIRMPLARGPVR